MIWRLPVYLHILQLEEYSNARLLQWWLTHPWQGKISQKKPLVWTTKARALLLGALVCYLLITVGVILFPGWISLGVLGGLLLFPFLSLIFSNLFFSPFESWQRLNWREKTRKEILRHPNLTVIGITGSYGKTSVKEFLYHILRYQDQTIRTPASYNTLLGIAKTIQFELLRKTRYFLCEMGAYQRGEIRELTQEAPPDYAILTAIGTQHLERFGSLRNTTLGKFELIEAVKPSHALVNIDNQHIRNHIASHNEFSLVNTYSVEGNPATFQAKSVQFSSKGVEFDLLYDKSSLHLRSPLFGSAHLSNVVAAASMALLLGLPENLVQKTVARLPQVSHRLELTSYGKATLIDNAFSSNQEGFHLVMQDLRKLPGKKVLITPGLIELGSGSHKIHFELGEQAASLFDRIYLVGESTRINGFLQGVKSVKEKLPITFLPNEANLWPLVEELSLKYDWILIENDLPDNYQ